MVQITDFPFLGKFIPLARKGSSSDNRFTVILGKNGVGKSRLLAELVSNFSKPLLDKESKYYVGQLNSLPSKIIAVSTSPFDKFPAARRDLNASSAYSYIGMRASSAVTSNQMALILSAAKGLMTKYLETEQHENLIEIFELLSLKPTLNFVFRLNLRQKIEIKTPEGGRIQFSFEGMIPDFYNDEPDVLKEMMDESTFLKYIEENQESRAKIRHALAVLWDHIEHQRGMFFKLDFDYSSKHGTGFVSKEIVSSLLVLLSSNLVKLYDLKITKTTSSRSAHEMSLRRASSGEQCLLVMILGIAGHIKHNSLILIDEPEISLHPSWQAKFMDLIINIFRSYYDCHFIIATHSPQIVSRLSHKNCFITTMDDNILHNASDFHQRSADYQLTELFDSPGMMNEYVSRIAFTLLTKVKAQKSIMLIDEKMLSRLYQIKSNLELGDPNIELIDSVAEVCNYYATHQ
ncbi:putative ATPase [Pseudomonas fluorescens]|uniref:AAA family ATPase n=1 Tax=Pseudomonas fluorescens TaxID=294 RepID=UPI00209F2E2E|nr:AAA family ATPase [Pseudomonas fluorescens]MCP1486364.1 putative ATPase [Pseudomonas fluorescens]